jgi:small GTP-binding protein
VSRGPKYDVFISYSPADRNVAEELASRLNADKLSVWFDQERIGVGQNSVGADAALATSRTMLLIMSANAFSSDWGRLERQTILFREPGTDEGRFVPLRTDDSVLPETLRHFAWIDWRQRSRSDYRRILNVCRSAVRVRQRTTSSGLEKLKALPSHNSAVWSIAVTPDGSRAISGSLDGIVRAWSLNPHRELSRLRVLGGVSGLGITNDGKVGLIGTQSGGVSLWHIGDKQASQLSPYVHPVSSVALAGDGRWAAAASYDTASIHLWNIERNEYFRTSEIHRTGVRGVAMTPDGGSLVSGSYDGTLVVWDLTRSKPIGHVCDSQAPDIACVAITAGGNRAVSGSSDGAVRVWDLTSGKCIGLLEGHTGPVTAVTISPDGATAVSAGEDDAILTWNLGAELPRITSRAWVRGVYGLAFASDAAHVLAASDNVVRVWHIKSDEALGIRGPQVAYTNAKVLLVGDTAVGKTGLAIRLTRGVFEWTYSSHGVWATQMKLEAANPQTHLAREVWLWDFAGQSDYRLIHQLFMDETALAILVFNPQTEDPFEGLSQWNRALCRSARRPFKKLLVAGRCDRGGLIVSSQSVQRFCQDQGFAACLQTSALTGDGCENLKQAIFEQINWADIPWTASPQVFKDLKEAIVALKDEGKILLRVSELKQQLEVRLPDRRFTFEDLKGVIGLLAGPGIVWQLEFGDFVLLRPEIINAYAAAVVRSVRAHADEIGCISEQRVLEGDLLYCDMARLTPSEEQVVLRAMCQMFVNRGLCSREHTETGPLLVFPSYFKRERPAIEGHPAAMLTYRIQGDLDEIYASIVVRLNHTVVFEKDQLWKYAADFRTEQRKRLGLRLTKTGEGRGEMLIYSDPSIPEEVKVTFIRYIHNHLKTKDPGLLRIRHYVCSRCSTSVENHNAVDERLKRGLRDIVCVMCEARIELVDLIEQRFASDLIQEKAQQLDRDVTAKIDNESRELILVGHAYAVAGEAGQIFRPTPNSDWGIDGEIEFKDSLGNASGERVYLQLKSGDSYTYKRKRDGAEIFQIRKPRHSQYWQQQAYPVMLVIRTSDGSVRWMNVSEYLKQISQPDRKATQIVFQGDSFNASNLLKMRDKVLPIMR